MDLIPTLKGWVNMYYPGLRTAITEYNWGDETNLNGATTQADVLGISRTTKSGYSHSLDGASVNPSPTLISPWRSTATTTASFPPSETPASPPR